MSELHETSKSSIIDSLGNDTVKKRFKPNPTKLEWIRFVPGHTYTIRFVPHYNACVKAGNYVELKFHELENGGKAQCEGRDCKYCAILGEPITEAYCLVYLFNTTDLEHYITEKYYVLKVTSQILRFINDIEENELDCNISIFHVLKSCNVRVVCGLDDNKRLSFKGTNVSEDGIEVPFKPLDSEEKILTVLPSRDYPDINLFIKKNVLKENRYKNLPSTSKNQFGEFSNDTKDNFDINNLFVKEEQPIDDDLSDEEVLEKMERIEEVL